MKALILGYGSIGQRHAANLRALYPDCDQIIVDPDKGYKQREESEMDDFDLAIIASPTACHLSQMTELARHGVPFLCEKPPCMEAETDEYRGLVNGFEASGLRCAIAFQYRYHKQARHIQKLAWAGYISFAARDDLLTRYGPTIGGTMASHALDLALWAQGDPGQWEITSDGVLFKGKINHKNGGESLFDLRMDTGPRVSEVHGRNRMIDLAPDDSAYVKMLSAFVTWAGSTGSPTGAGRDSRLATLRDGLAVMEILSTCKAS